MCRTAEAPEVVCIDSYARQWLLLELSSRQFGKLSAKRRVHPAKLACSYHGTAFDFGEVYSKLLGHECVFGTVKTPCSSHMRAYRAYDTCLQGGRWSMAAIVLRCQVVTTPRHLGSHVLPIASHASKPR